ncbi:MAG: sulfatase-like hydrolase/transferase [Candidatus Hydrogenedentes bacterium]|nr:sulfatase-like hydrolase/transferase [Candidatus Hydrogenedentota bacterium]
MQFSRRQFLASSGCAAALAALPAVAQSKPMNVVVIVGDDHRADALGCAGHPFLQTPNLDRLAAEGVRFTNACVTTAICCTSRASIFTGMHATRHRVIDFATPFRPEHQKASYPEQFRAAGRRTGCFGKHGVNGYGAAEGAFDVVQAPAHGGLYFPKDDPDARHADDLHTEAAERFIEAEVAAGRSFCVSLGFQSPHALDYAEKPYQPAREFQSLYADLTMPDLAATAEGGFEVLPPFLRDSEGVRRFKHNFGGAERYQESVKNYYRMITGIDAYIGRLRETLARCGAADNTAIVYLGDNGYFLGERGLEGKWYAYERSIRVPMIVFNPRADGARRGVTVEHLVNELDVSPTILDLAGIAIPEGVQGQSLRPLMEGQSVEWRKDCLYHHHFKHPHIPRSEGVLSREWKYIRWIDGDPGAEELYDLRVDPWERNNLAGIAEHAETLERHRKRHYELLSAMA